VKMTVKPVHEAGEIISRIRTKAGNIKMGMNKMLRIISQGRSTLVLWRGLHAP
jgi:hypothetical protein